MKDNTQATPTNSLVKSLFPQNATTILYGKHGIGMSTLGLYLCVLAASDKPPMPCLYLDFESDRKSIVAKWEAIIKAQKLSKHLLLFYYSCNQPIANIVKTAYFKKLLDAMKALELGLIVIDPITMAIPNSDDEKAATQGLKAIESLGATRIAIAHLSKSGKEPYGSSILSNHARAIYKVERRESNEKMLSLDISCKKSNRSKMPEPVRLDIKISKTASSKRSLGNPSDKAPY